MHLTAYILAADPAWIEDSVNSYYDIVDEIIVSYDQSKRGWTGEYIPVDECLNRLRLIDRDHKLRLCPGDYARLDHTPMENDTNQRQAALSAAGADADWILQVDTDEVIPTTDALVKVIQAAAEQGISAVEWPMRVLFQRLRDGRFLEVCSLDGHDRFEYPGAVAVRPDAKLVDARRVGGVFLRPLVAGDDYSMQICRPTEQNESRQQLLTGADAILHFSWVRSASALRGKIASWGHSQGWRSWLFYYRYWLPAPRLWRTMHDFHPFARGLWPALKVSQQVPAGHVKQRRS